MPTVQSDAGQSVAVEPPDRPTAARRNRRADLLVAGAALALAVWITSGLWPDPFGRAITVNSSDQALFEWLLAYGAHALTHGENPLFTYLLNVPDGVNLAVNTSISVYAFAFAPLTLLVGPPVSFLVILVLNLTATAYAWYWFMSRQLELSAAASAIGGLFCGFAPQMVSHANAHLNWTAQWLVPLLLWRVFKLREPGRAVRNGLILGGLVAIAFSIAAEALFFTALACAVFLGCWAATRAHRTEARAALPTFVRGLAVTAGTAAVLLAYPLWLHFFGRQRYHGTGFSHRVHSEDLAAYFAFPARSLAGVAGFDTRLAPNPTEENSFFGIPLVLLVVACYVLLRRASDPARRAMVWALAVTGAVFAVLSLGPAVKWFGEFTDLWLPYVVLGALPVFDAALPARLALVVTPVVGLLLAYAYDCVRPAPRPVRLRWSLAFAAALLPLLPMPLLVTGRSPIPAFITSGTWREYVSDGGVLAPVPLTSDLLPDAQRWQAYALAHRQGEFAIPAGFFLGPGGPDGRGRIGPVPRSTALLLADIARTGYVPVIDDADRAAAREDLRFWHAQVVVLPDRVDGAKWPVHVDAVLEATTSLLGPPQRVTDVWLWRGTPR